ncbi:hypothetical protein [Haliangium sp.]|uniref:hypothetical protein n=1 Tax=Haliangium sp. TaxID=2663208 RepID=UPI003D0D5DD2
MTLDASPESASPCRVTVVSEGDGHYALRFHLRNPGDTAVEVESYQPFLDFALVAQAGGQPVAVHQPALDIPVNPVALTIPADGELTLDTPIRLRVAAGADPGDDGFIWTVASAPEAVTLTATLDLPAPFDRPCPVRLR